VPIALGLAALYAQSAWEIASGRGEGYLDSLAGLVFFLLCGRVFQQVTHGRLAFDRNYRSFFPLSVTRKVSPSSRNQVAEALAEEPEIRNPKSGAHRSLLTSATPHTLGEERISLSQLQVGDRVLIRNGELIPADAILVRGPALTNYSFVTGESEPVAKTAGAYLYAGGQQIGGAIEIETVKPVSQSYLASLWSHKTFQKDRDWSFETLTNRFSRHFTLAVLVVALGSAAFWLGSGNPARALRAFIAVLIVACPCALALAAPFTFGTAQRWLARAGVFLRNTLVLERLSQVDSVVFDKTGTLTASGANAVSFEPGGSRHEEALSAESIIRNPKFPKASLRQRVRSRG
jgi:Cu+-exporting ATPase